MSLPLLKVTPAPLAGTANVTVTLGIGLPLASVTVAISGLAKGVYDSALGHRRRWERKGDAAPGLLVSVKLAEVATPETEALKNPV